MPYIHAHHVEALLAHMPQVLLCSALGLVINGISMAIVQRLSALTLKALMQLKLVITMVRHVETQG